MTQISKFLQISVLACTPFFLSAQSFIGGTANEDLGTPANWAGGSLPTTSGTPGTLNLNATVDGSTTYAGLFITQTAGDVTQDDQGGNSYTFEGGAYLMQGGTWGTRRGISIGADQTFTVDGGTFGVAIPGGGGDSAMAVDTDGSFILNSGSLTVSTDNFFNRGGSLTVNGGTFDVLTTFGNASFNGAGGTTNFNGGTTSINNINFAGGSGLLNFGGATAGSVSASTLAGNYTLDWSSGSQMTFTVAGQNQAFFEGLYSSGDLLFEGSNASSFSDNFSVAGDTLTLASVIPEPTNVALLGLAGILLTVYRRRCR